MNCWPTMPVAPRMPTGIFFWDIVISASEQKKSRRGKPRVGAVVKLG